MKTPSFLALAALLAPTALVQADVITPAETLVITFTVSPSANPTPDVLRLNFGLTDVLSPLTTRIASLYDGGTLLGTAVATNFGGHQGLLNLNPSNSWKSPTSLWTFGNPATVDFTTIQNGTIDGRIEYTVQTGAHDITLTSVYLSMIKASSGSGGSVTSPPPVITSIAVVGQNPGLAYCFGDGSGSGCPCGNNGAVGEGCSNASGMGATLDATGVAVVGNDSLVLSASQCPSNVPGLFFSGPLAQAGVPFGDGLLCVTGSLLRLGIVFTDGNGDAATNFTISVVEGLGGGEVRRYQYWYRDPAGPCNGGFNTTNGYEIQW